MESYDEYFDEVDSDLLQEVADIEATHTLSAARAQSQPAWTHPPVARRQSHSDAIATDDSDEFGSLTLDDQDLQIISKLENDARTPKSASSSRYNDSSVSNGSVGLPRKTKQWNRIAIDEPERRKTQDAKGKGKDSPSFGHGLAEQKQPKAFGPFSIRCVILLAISKYPVKVLTGNSLDRYV